MIYVTTIDRLQCVLNGLIESDKIDFIDFFADGAARQHDGLEQHLKTDVHMGGVIEVVMPGQMTHLIP